MGVERALVVIRAAYPRTGVAEVACASERTCCVSTRRASVAVMEAQRAFIKIDTANAATRVARIAGTGK